MKTILAATDFSSAAHNAAVYAASLAKVFNARLILYNAYQQIAYPAVEATAFISEEELKGQVKQQLEKEAAALDRYSQIVVETVFDENSPANGILEAAENCKANIIVMGMKASGKGLRKLIGSAVTGLIRKTTIPVIVVPEEVRSGRLNTMAFATDSDISPESDPHILDRLRELGERFSSKLYLVRIAKNKFSEAFEVLNRPFRINRMVRTLDPVYEAIEGKDITIALSDFIREYKVDMLALLPHKHSLLETWFNKSITRSMVFETHIPLLILPEYQRELENTTDLGRKSSL
jgi:nucleotide-binding universal stress UspA family protein